MTTRREEPEDRAVYIISVAAELAGVHPQTLRIYERKGLLAPARTPGRTRRYSDHDIARLREIQRLTQDGGVNLAGVAMILELRERLDAARARAAELEAEAVRAEERIREAVAAAERRGRFDLVPYQPPPSPMRRT